MNIHVNLLKNLLFLTIDFPHDHSALINLVVK
jgi:hypothetical protein